MKIGEICVKKWRKEDPGLLLWLHRFSSAVPYTLLSTWASLRNPIIRIEVAVADLMTFTLSALEEDLDPLKGRPISSNSMIGVFLWLVKMEKVAKTYKARFVVNISEQGEDDPLAQNASSLFSHLGIPWYNTSQLQPLPVFSISVHTTIDSKNLKVDWFLEEINITRGKKLYIVGVNTGSLQELMGSISGSGDNQLNLLAQTLEAVVGSWVIVIGYHPVVVCEEDKEQIEAKQVHESLHHTFVKYRVNAYLSKQGCVSYTRKGGVAYIGVPEPIQRLPHLASLVPSFREEVLDGFLLHRISSLEITTYYVTSDEEVPDKTVEQQRGKDVM